MKIYTEKQCNDKNHLLNLAFALSNSNSEHNGFKF